MKFNVVIDKKAEAVIDRKLCINCGDCSEMCPTGAVSEYMKTAFCMDADKDKRNAGTFGDAKRRALENACSAGCPLGIIPQTVASLIQKGELEEAAKHIWKRNPMPSICASVCDHFCQDYCQRSVFGDAPLNMKDLEEYVLANTEARTFKYIRKYHEKMAVIGGGPAGLSAAYHLAKAGYVVTIFEKDQVLGGAAKWGIPAFRLDKDMMEEEIDRIISAGVEVRYGWHIGKNHSLDELWQEGYSACLIAVGDSFGVMPQIRGCDGEGVYDGVTVMRQVTGGYDENVHIGDKVVVVGSGGFAADLARVLRRMDKEVLCVAAQTEDDLQMPQKLVKILEEEGVEFRTATTVEQIITEAGKVKAVELKKGNAVNYFCDTVIFAVGQKCVTDNICNAQTYPDGKIRIDDRYRTNKQMIFACGDATGETASVVEAVAAGKAAAVEMDKAVRGNVDPVKKHQRLNAPDGLAIYDDNVAHGVPHNAEDEVNDIIEPTEDIIAVMRAAGIGETWENFVFDETAQKVAVVGGGVAGITAAIALARKGYRPTIFEKETEIGGVYRWLSTDKRVDKKLLERELAKVKASGIEIVCGVTAAVKPDISQLFKMGYDAVLLAIGEYGGSRHYVTGADACGVFDMAALMGRLADNEVPASVGGKVLVAGGDEMTLDIAVKLKELCSEVTVLSPWSRGSLQARTGAVEAALNEGVNLVTGVEVIKVEEKNGRAYSAICKVTEKGHTINIPCDTLVMGGGGPATQTIALRNLRLDIDETGHVAVDCNLATSIKGVFAIGDLAMSAADVGRVGAAAVDNFLSGTEGYLSLGDMDKAKMPTDYEIVQGNIYITEKGFSGFTKGQAVFSMEAAVAEASRCMDCGYHQLQASRCMGCGVCLRVCPVNAISMIAVNENGEGSADKEVQHGN